MQVVQEALTSGSLTIKLQIKDLTPQTTRSGNIMVIRYFTKTKIQIMLICVQINT